MSRNGMVRARLRSLRALWADEEAPTAVEYGLMVGLVTLVIIGAVSTLGQIVLTNLFERAAAMP